MSLPTRLTALGAESVPLRETSNTKAEHLAMRAIERRFAAVLLESALPKSVASLGKGLSGSMAREQLVDRIAQVLSDSDALGIAKAANLREAAPAVGATDEKQQNR